jgi:hypothetical protein
MNVKCLHKLGLAMLLLSNSLGDGLLLCLWPPGQYWNIAAGDPSIYYFSGTLTLTSPTNSVPKDLASSGAVWTGTLRLPRTKIQLQKATP